MRILMIVALLLAGGRRSDLTTRSVNRNVTPSINNGHLSS